MARMPRFELPGYPQHIIHRGNNRQPILQDEDDYWELWGRLRDAAAKHACAIHAYVFMPDHIHLLLTPRREHGIGKLMQLIGRHYVRYVNQRYSRTGTLWDGRYRATLLDPDAYLLAVGRYIETNPVRAGLVSAPEDYDWSSYAANALGVEDEVVTPHPLYQALGPSAEQRCSVYQAGFEEPIEDALLKRIREATNKAWVLGDDAFCNAVETQLDRRTQPRQRGGDRRSAAYRQGKSPH
jgi:putative transposase